MLWNFCVDGLAVLRLRFKALEQYHYHWLTMLGVITFLGMRIYLFLYPIIGIKPAVFILCVLAEAVRCVVLTETIRKILVLKQTLKTIFPFILLSESLSLLSLIFLLAPADSPIQILNLVVMLWVYMAQMIGLMWFSKKSAFKVFLGYIIYFFATILAMSMILVIFNAANLIERDDMQKIMDYVEQNMKQNTK